MFNAEETFFDKKYVVSKEKKTENLSIVFQPDLQIEMKVNFAEQTLLQLRQTISYRRSVGLNVKQFLFSFWQRLLQPITTLVMICLAIPFVFGSARSATMGTRVMIGVFIGFAFYIMGQLFGPITLLYQYPPILAAITPTGLFLLILVILLLKA